jgi:cysteinyl-tRNA synthetase
LSALATEANKSEPHEWPRLKGQMLASGALLGVLQQDPDDWARGDATDARRIDGLVAERIAARRAKNFAEADRIRGELASEGIEIMDTPEGSTWRRV